MGDMKSQSYTARKSSESEDILRGLYYTAKGKHPLSFPPMSLLSHRKKDLSRITAAEETLSALTVVLTAS